MKDFKELLNVTKILEPLINKKANNKLSIQNASVTKVQNTNGSSTGGTSTVERSQVPILQMYARPSQNGNAGEHSNDITTESKFYPLVSSEAVIVDSKKWIATINCFKELISLYGAKIGMTEDSINKCLNSYDDCIENESSDPSYSCNIFYPIRAICDLLKPLYKNAANQSSSINTLCRIRSFSISKDKWIKSSSSDSLLEYYIYNIDISESLSYLRQKLIVNNENNNDLEFSFVISPYEECTSNDYQTNTSATLTTADIQYNNIKNMLLFSEYGITKIDEDIQNNTITIMSKKQPSEDIKINIAINAKILVPE